jgi:predicted small lipoprotein YifL
MIPRSIAALLAAALTLVGCGLKGPLYLPEKPGEVTIRPGPAGAPQPAGSSATSAPPSTPQSPGGTDRPATQEPPAGGEGPPAPPPDTLPELPPGEGDTTGG